MTPEHGDICWLEAPDATRRPALIVSRVDVIDLLSDVIVLPVTSTVRGLPTEIHLGPAEGMRRRCVANAQQIKEVPKAHLRGRAGHLGAARWHEVCDAVAIAIGC